LTGESLENEFVGATHLVPDLRTRVVRGGIWVFALRIADRLFRLARTIVLARLLAPEHFGLFGIALLAMSAVETFSQTGFSAALIQKKEETKSYLDTAWTVHAIRGILLALIVFAIAPYVARFFDAPAAKPILQVIAFSVLLGGFTNIGVIYFQKELEFHKTFIYQLSGTLADIGVAISAAFLLRNVWALVFGLLAGNLVRTVVSYFIHPYRPHPCFNQQQFKELFGFGKWLLGSSILVFLITQGDNIFVGKLLGVAALGFYQLAYRLSNIPATEITHVISRVTFPAYSKLQGNLPRLREAYLKVLQLTAFLSFPIAGLIFVLAPDFTRIFLGQKWMPMVPGMQGLVLAGLMRSIMATTGPIFLSVGRPQIETKWQVVRLIVLGASIYPFGVQWGILGVSIAVLLSSLVSTVGFICMAVKITTCKKRAFAKVITFPLISGLLMASLVFGLKAGNSRLGAWGFFLLAGVGGLSYLSVIYLLDRYLNYKMELLLRENLNCLRRI
jgi:O-antigen/teichoic acid export membrane protein